jgi:hypothetical protein
MYAKNPYISSLSPRKASGTTRAVQRKYACLVSLYLALPARLHGVQTLWVLAAWFFSGAGRALRGGVVSSHCGKRGTLLFSLLPILSGIPWRTSGTPSVTVPIRSGFC